MATRRPKYLRSVKQQKRATYKRSSGKDQKANVICTCRACKKTLCQYCRKSSKKFKHLKGKTTDNVTDGPEVVILPSVVMGDRRLASQYWDVNFSEYLSKNFKEVLAIKPGPCFKIKLVMDKIWAPLYYGNVNVYNKDGNIMKTIAIESPISVEQADNGDIFIACHSTSGLYLLDEHEAPHKICDGSFADVYAHKDKVYALEYETKMMMEFCYRPDIDDVKQRWRCEMQWKVDEASADDKLIVTGGEDLQLFVSHYNNHKISQYNRQGKCINTFGSSQETGEGNLCNPWLCGIDGQSHLLVADCGNNVNKILDPGTGQWRSTGVRGDNYVYDAKLDDEEKLWLSHHNGSDHIIIKHEPQ